MKHLIPANLALSLLAKPAFGLLLCLAFAFSADARAERCSIEGHSDELVSVYENALKKSLATLPKKAGFAMNPSTLELKTEYIQVSDDEYLPFPELEISGGFQSDKGTDFDILVQSADIWITDNGQSTQLSTGGGDVIFTPTLLSRGHDREGNPIEPRCRLTTNAWFTIRNKKNGRIITRFELPSSVTINTQEQK